MIFEWDEAKSRANARERLLPFDVAAAMFDGPTLEAVDARRDYGEVRIKVIGELGGLYLTCVYTARGEAIGSSACV
jgi:uncharacterized DUF497 family protein